MTVNDECATIENGVPRTKTTTDTATAPDDDGNVISLPARVSEQKLAYPKRKRSRKQSISDVICRDASPSQKGQRLQRLRAAHFVFEAIADSSVRRCYVAVEADGDASVRKAVDGASQSYKEEDKAYAESSTLSFVSDAIRNTMVIFLDQWFESGRSPNVRFGFFTPAGVAQETTSERIQRLGITLPPNGVLGQLVEGKTIDPLVLAAARTIVLDEYRTQYQDRDFHGYQSKIEAWNDDDWSQFFAQIRWRLNAETPEKCEEIVLNDIKNCRFYRPGHQGREDTIKAMLLEKLDERQHLTDPVERHVSSDEVENIFLRLSQEPDIRPTDATWQSWEKLPHPVDQRGLADKFSQACKGLSKNALKRYQRQAADALLEFDALSQDKNVLAMRYQIYDVCDQQLGELLTARFIVTSAEHLDSIVDGLVAAAEERVATRAKDYAYRVTNAPFIRNIVYNLFQECYLSFDLPDEQDDQ
jgi:hypothetical protein